MHVLFLRQLWVTPDYAVESFGTPAYDEIIAHFAGDQPGSEEIPAQLRPHIHLQMCWGDSCTKIESVGKICADLREDQDEGNPFSRQIPAGEPSLTHAESLISSL
jgi:hypothetical protein